MFCSKAGVFSSPCFLRCPHLAGDLVGRLHLAFAAFGAWHATSELLHQVFDSGFGPACWCWICWFSEVHGKFSKQCDWGVLTVGAKGPGLEQGAPSDLRPFGCKFLNKSSLLRCPCAFRLRSLAQSERPVLLVFKGVVLLACCAVFLSYVHFVWQAWDIWDILRSKTSFCVTGAGHRTFFHLCGRRGTAGR